MKNKRGYTLIELLVVISILAILSITIGVSAQNIQKSSTKTEGRDVLNELFNAARIYSELNNVGDGCTKWSTSSNDITIKCMIKSGLLEKDIYEEDNPLRSDGTKLKETDTVKVTISSKIKIASFTYGSCTVNDSDLSSTDKTVKENVNNNIGGC